MEGSCYSWMGNATKLYLEAIHNRYTICNKNTWIDWVGEELRKILLRIKKLNTSYLEEKNTSSREDCFVGYKNIHINRMENKKNHL